MLSEKLEDQLHVTSGVLGISSGFAWKRVHRALKSPELTGNDAKLWSNTNPATIREFIQKRRSIIKNTGYDGEFAENVREWAKRNPSVPHIKKPKKEKTKKTEPDKGEITVHVTRLRQAFEKLNKKRSNLLDQRESIDRKLEEIDKEFVKAEDLLDFLTKEA